MLAPPIHGITTSHPYTSPIRLLPRDSSTTGKLSTSTIIAISVACGCVVILALSLFLWRFLLRLCRPNRSTPLPPVQPLAHHREQQLAAFVDRNRPASWAESSLHAPQYLHATSSDLSLLPGTPKGSLYTDELATAESSSTLPSPHSNNDMYLPPPKFVLAPSPTSTPSDGSMTSLNGPNTYDTFGSVVSPSGSVPYSETNSSSFSSHITATSSTHPLISLHSQTPSPSRSRSTVRGRSQSRPTSMVSFAGSSYSGHTSRIGHTVIRGAPHSIHNNVQIVLPAPLAPQLHPYMQPLNEDAISNFPETRSRSSVFVDRWVSVGAPPDGNANTGSPARPTRNQQRRSSSHNARSQNRSSSSVETRSSQTTDHQRAKSQPPVSSQRASATSSSQRPPPVPRIPSAYKLNAASQALEMDGEPERGRSRTSKQGSLSSAAEKPLPSSPAVGIQAADAKPRTLRKQRPESGS